MNNGHAPSHRRTAFLAWVAANFPPVAEIEVDYEERTIPATDLLRLFVLPLPCIDYVPAEARRTILVHLGRTEDVKHMTYAVAAMLVLARSDGLLDALYPQEIE